VKTLRETILKHSWQEDMVGPDLVRVDDAIDALREWLDQRGLAIVPREADQDMIGAVLELGALRWEVMKTYAKMIAAAPDALRDEGE
jgi:hypothetical protein